MNSWMWGSPWAVIKSAKFHIISPAINFWALNMSNASWVFWRSVHWYCSLNTRLGCYNYLFQRLELLFTKKQLFLPLWFMRSILLAPTKFSPASASAHLGGQVLSASVHLGGQILSASAHLGGQVLSQISQKKFFFFLHQTWPFENWAKTIVERVNLES